MAYQHHTKDFFKQSEMRGSKIMGERKKAKFKWREIFPFSTRI
jgi:hypothetical protein